MTAELVRLWVTEYLLLLSVTIIVGALFARALILSVGRSSYVMAAFLSDPRKDRANYISANKEMVLKEGPKVLGFVVLITLGYAIVALLIWTFF